MANFFCFRDSSRSKEESILPVAFVVRQMD